MCEIRIINNETYSKKGKNISSEFVIIKDDVIVKGFFDKRFKKIKENDEYYKFKSKPKLRFYFYDKNTKVKKDIKKDDRYVFIGDFNIEIEASKEHDKYFLVSKNISKKITSHKD